MRKISTFTAKRAGRRDGRPFRFVPYPPFKEPKTSYPLVEQETPPEFEGVLRGSAEAMLARLSKRWHREDEVLHRRFCQAVNHRQGLLSAQEETRRDYENAKSNVDALRRSIDAFQDPVLNPKWGLVFLVIIGISEFVFNAAAFSILGEGRLLTWAFAAGMGIGLPLLSHFFGQSLKQDSGTDRRLNFWSPIAALLLISTVSIIRAIFFSGVVTVISGMRAREYAILLGIINAVLYIIATFVSYKSSRTKEVEYRTKIRQLRMAQVKLKKASQKAAKIDSRIAAVEDEILQSLHNREKRFEEVRSKAGEIISSFHFLVQTYRRWNMLARDSRPRCFNVDPVEPRVPSNLSQISWKCIPLDLTEVNKYVFKNNNNGSDSNIASLLLTRRTSDQ